MLALHRSPMEVAGFGVLLVAGLVAAVALGRRRRQPMSLALAASAVVGALVGAASLTHADGPVYLYFALWLAYVPLAVLLALGVAMFGRVPDETPAEQLRPTEPVRRCRRGRRGLSSRCAWPPHSWRRRSPWGQT